MTILSIHVYRDGGTILIETDKGKYWLPPDKTVIGKGESFGGTESAGPDIHDELVRQAFGYAARFFDVKRLVK